jgi:hypothetical protein
MSYDVRQYSKRIPNENRKIDGVRLSEKLCLPLLNFLVLVRVGQLQATLRKVVVELNLFKHHTSTDRKIRYQRYATRVYIFLILISVIFLTEYTLVRKSIHRQTLSNPTEAQYLELEQVYHYALFKFDHDSLFFSSVMFE